MYTNYFIYKKQLKLNIYTIIDCEKDILENLEDKIKLNHNLYICCDTLNKTNLFLII